MAKEIIWYIAVLGAKDDSLGIYNEVPLQLLSKILITKMPYLAHEDKL